MIWDFGSDGLPPENKPKTGFCKWLEKQFLKFQFGNDMDCCLLGNRRMTVP